MIIVCTSTPNPLQLHTTPYKLKPFKSRVAFGEQAWHWKIVELWTDFRSETSTVLCQTCLPLGTSSQISISEIWFPLLMVKSCQMPILSPLYTDPVCVSLDKVKNTAWWFSWRFLPLDVMLFWWDNGNLSNLTPWNLEVKASWKMIKRKKNQPTKH